MSLQAIAAGRGFIEMLVKDGTDKGLEIVAGKLKGFSKTVAGIGAGLTAVGAMITAPLLAALPAYAKMGEELDLFAQKTGMSVGMASELKEGLQDIGTDLPALQKGMTKFSQTISEAAGGSKTAAADLAEFGLSAKDLLAVSPDQRLGMIADALSKIPDPGMRAAAAMKLLGKGGVDLIPLLAGGAAGLDAIRAKAAALGESDMGADKAVALSAAYDDFGRVWKSIPRAAVAAIAEPMTRWLNWLVGIGAGAKTWIKEHQPLIQTAFKVGAAITAVGTAFLGLAAVSKVASVLQNPLTKMLASGAVAAASNPIGLVTIALVAGVAAWMRWTESGQAALAAIKEAFGPMVETVMGAVTGIKDALASGNFALAAQIAGTGIKLAFLQALGGISTLMGSIFGDTGERLKSLGSDALQGNWKAVIGDLGGMWANYCGGIVKMFMGAIDQITKLWSGAVSKIANWLLEASASGGVMGAVASGMLGVDMGKEEGRSKMLTMKTQEMDRKLAADSIPEIEKNLNAAKDAGDTEKVAANERFLAEQKSKAAGTFDYDSKSAMDVARASVDQQVAGWQDAVKGWTDNVRTGVDVAKETIDDWTEQQRDANGTNGFDELTGQLKEDLARLNAQAAAEKADFEAKMKAGGGKVADQGDEGPLGPAAKSLGPVGTFSAYSLGQQLGAGTNTQEQILATAQEQKALQEEGNRMWRDLVAMSRNGIGPTWGALGTDGAA